ncbi:unnamed protein product [Pleuronectes platessa]|uniref:Uncharacterized protein n=1 Tax=Pleuronectes platessa TaxID=8262 RepID=A0A9N7W4X7_PLEPL|nr:unnamed protein product [Pleuronectes platessa]
MLAARALGSPGPRPTCYRPYVFANNTLEYAPLAAGDARGACPRVTGTPADVLQALRLRVARTGSRTRRGKPDRPGSLSLRVTGTPMGETILNASGRASPSARAFGSQRPRSMRLANVGIPGVLRHTGTQLGAGRGLKCGSQGTAGAGAWSLLGGPGQRNLTKCGMENQEREAL